MAVIACVVVLVYNAGCSSGSGNSKKAATAEITKMAIPDTSLIPRDAAGDMVRYGIELLTHTAKYIGPEGIAGKYLGNRMSCSNCHLDAGTRLFGFPLYTTFARYPQYRGREDKVLTLGERINNCVERPHNGKALPLESREIAAMTAYIKWLSEHIPPEYSAHISKGASLKYPARPSDPKRGASIYSSQCQRCHGADGSGLWNRDSSEYIYPPLWGPMAYQAGSSPHRVLMLAKFIKYNMPDKLARWDKPFLTDEDAIDVAAFINNDAIHDRPAKRAGSSPDYPKYNVKPIDYPAGPYVDTFPAGQHKFGPYQPIIDFHKAGGLPVIF